MLPYTNRTEFPGQGLGEQFGGGPVRPPAESGRLDQDLVMVCVG